MNVRLARPDDMPAIQQLWNEQEAALGVKLDRPDLFKEPVLLTVVAEDETGIRMAAYGEAIVEFCLIGCDPQGTVAIRKASADLVMFFRHRGFRWIRTFIPNWLVAVLEKPLSRVGYVNEQTALTHFSLDLRAPAHRAQHKPERTEAPLTTALPSHVGERHGKNGSAGIIPS